MNVLLATDGQPHTARTVEYAIEYAYRYKAGLFILFVVCPGADRNTAIINGKEALESIKLKALAQGVGVTTMLESGDPADTIIATADKIEADSIIMGASGKCELNRKRPLGSVSSRVVQNACCSVTVIR